MKKESALYALALFAAILAIVASAAFSDIAVRAASGAVCALTSAIFCGFALHETLTRQQMKESARTTLQLEEKNWYMDYSEQRINAIRQLFRELDEKSNQRIDVVRELFASVQSSNQHLSEKLQANHTELVLQTRSISDTLSEKIQDNISKGGQSATSIIKQLDELLNAVDAANKSLKDQLAAVNRTVENSLTRTAVSTQEVGKIVTRSIEARNQATIEALQSSSETLGKAIEDNTSKIEESAVEVLDQCDALERCIRQVTEVLDGVKSAVEEVSSLQLSGHKLEKESLGKVAESISDMESAVKDVTRAVEHMEETAERQVESYDNIMQNYAHITAQDAKLIEKVFSA